MSWLMGGSTQLGWEFIWVILPYLVIGLGVLITSGHVLNLLQFGDEQAQQLGLNVTRSKTIILIMASMATAAAV
ncbi:MAG: iron ABC transporter permease, partial [Anaerolineales bacterium]|nr:iron ABC transporter permease [Anaerolineales bacterium]